MVGQTLGAQTGQVEGPDVLGPPTAVALPAAEIAVDRGIDQVLAVGGKHAAAAFCYRQRDLQATVGGYQIGPAAALVVGHAIDTHEDVPAVRAPVQHAVIRTAARRH